jgi:tRNA-splicing ligase RtcB
MDVHILGDHDDKTIQQLEQCVAIEEGAKGVLCADGHLGYSMPIGGVVAYRDHVSPSGVGFDIGCGNKAARTNLNYEDVAKDLPRIMDEVFERISFGVGRKDGKARDHPVIDEIRHAPFAPQRELAKTAAQQLGTVGAGNHYVDLFRDEGDRIWVGVHFGSRGFGHKTASGFLAPRPRPPVRGAGERGRDDDPAGRVPASSELGRSYVEAMTLAGRYATPAATWSSPRCSTSSAPSRTSRSTTTTTSAGQKNTRATAWVVRKGATPAFPGQLGFVGATMGEPAVILEGVESPASKAALYSTVHGAGRRCRAPRPPARWAREWKCGVRECPALGHPPRLPGRRTLPRAPEGEDAQAPGPIKPGRIDFATVQQELAAKGIELRGGAADEAPAAYKRLDEVLAYTRAPSGSSIASTPSASRWRPRRPTTPSRIEGAAPRTAPNRSDALDDRAGAEAAAAAHRHEAGLAVGALHLVQERRQQRAPVDPSGCRAPSRRR